MLCNQVRTPVKSQRQSCDCWYVATFSLVAQKVERLLAMQETQVQSLGWEDPLEKEMATHSSTLAWKIPWMEEPRRLHGVAKSQTRLSDFTFTFFLNFRHENSRNSICIPMSLSAKRDVLKSNGEHLLHSRLHPTFYSAFLVTISLNKREKNFFLAFT